jgi:hypothetical protein
MVTIMVARSLRYYIEGTLAVFYGKQVLEFLHQYGLTILGLVALACLAGLSLYLIWTRVRQTRRGKLQEQAPTPAAQGGGEKEAADAATTSGVTR